MNWQRGFNRAWLIISICFSFIPAGIIVSESRYDSFLSAIFRFITVSFVVLAIVYFTGRIVQLIISWAVKGFR
jgi:putative effector of murein hydrolase LrgA (UPF0299 family)